MACGKDELRHVPLFALLDDDELSLLASLVELRKFGARQRIYKIGEAPDRAYVMLGGFVRVTTVDEDQQEVVVDEPRHGEFFGFASMIEQVPHRTSAHAMEESTCLEVNRTAIETLLTRKPMAGMDMMTALGRQFHAAQELARRRASRNANEIIEEESTFAQRLADGVARFGGSWTFIITCGIALTVYVSTNVILRHHAWDPYPFILLNLFLSMLAAIQAPVIMMSQNRQDMKDRLRSELDYAVNRRAESEIQGLSAKLHTLTDKIDDLDDMLRRPDPPDHDSPEQDPPDALVRRAPIPEPSPR
jgi:CRP/FNR family transcriptional regulator, cyclic AMP receptor protein